MSSSIEKLVEMIVNIDWTDKEEIIELKEELIDNIKWERKNLIEYIENIKEDEPDSKILQETIQYNEYLSDLKIDMMNHVLIKVNEFIYNIKEFPVTKKQRC